MNYTDFFWINAVEYVIVIERLYWRNFIFFIKRVYYNTATFKQTQYIDRDLNET